MLFHYLSRFSDDYPYANQFVEVGRYGWLGVDLFFVISGFVIALTLYDTRSPFDFLVRRVARLVPAMLICATISFLMLWWIDTPFAIAHRVGFAGFVPSLTFTDPWLWQKLLPGTDYIDGAYWSLFVEVRFYFWAALTYYLVGRRWFLPTFLVGALMALCAYGLLPEKSAKLAVLMLFFPHYLPLFCTGMLAHALHDGQRSLLVKLAFLLFAGLAVWSVQVDGVIPMLITAAIVALFPILLYRRRWLAPLAHPALVLVGSSSYSLYLIHQYVGVSVITLLPPGQSMLVYAACLIALILALIACGYLVYRTVEQPIQRGTRHWLKRWQAITA